jgi:hypothetical protein
VPDRAAALERHCRRLLVAYPPDFRARLGAELVAMVRLVRGGKAQPWLWAAAFLPAGWFGPFDSAGLRVAADQPVPQFGRRRCCSRPAWP